MPQVAVFFFFLINIIIYKNESSFNDPEVYFFNNGTVCIVFINTGISKNIPAGEFSLGKKSKQLFLFRSSTTQS